MSSISDLIASAQAGEPAALADHFSALMAPKIAAGINDMVPSVAAGMFEPTSEE